jgi:dTDP-4-amino-4,6-dideoxygalactose transaminase
LVNILASLGCSQLIKLPERLIQKRKIFDFYKEALQSRSDVRIHEEWGTNSNHWLINLRFRTLEQREKVLFHLISKGIQARPLWELNHRQMAYRSYEQPKTTFENAKNVWETTLSIPSSPHLDESTLKMISSEIVEALN